MWWRASALVIFMVICIHPAPGSGQTKNVQYGGRMQPRPVSRPVRQKPGGYADSSSGGYGGYQKPSGGYDYKPTTRGYVYAPPTTTAGYVYKPPPTTTTTTTTPEPGIESDRDIDSSGITPPPPQPVEPEKGFEVSPDVNEHDEWDIRDSVPGSPGDDYPVLGNIPRTGFKCEGRLPGYYADPVARCQVFHRCSDCTDNVRLQMDSFLCPNGTQFNQEILACDWWANVHCEDSENYYKLNQEIGVRGGDGEYVKFSGSRQAPELTQKKVAPIIIPKDLRSPLPAIYRSNHIHDEGSHHGSSNSNSNSGTKVRPPPPPAADVPAPTTKKPDTLFNEFSRPRPTADDSLNNALNNPDYFAEVDPKNTDATPLSVAPTSASSSPAADPPKAPSSSSTNVDDYFDELQESRPDEVKLPNEPLPAPTTRATPTSSSTAATTIAPAVVAEDAGPPYESEDEGSVQAILPKETPNFLKEGDKASGFIVNRSRLNKNQNNNKVKEDDHLKASSTLPEIQREIQPPGTRLDSYDDSPSSGNSGYAPPKDTYLPPATSTEAAPVRAPKPTYLPPEAPKPSYLPPQEPEPSYLPPVADSQADYFLAPPKPSYGPPEEPKGGYDSPAQPQPSYGPPVEAPKADYLPPRDDYLPPKDEYLPPRDDYLPPKPEPQPVYLPPTNPQNDYLPPKNDYLPPQNNYLPPQNTYTTPQQGPSTSFTPPSSQYGQPQQEYQYNAAPIPNIPVVRPAPFVFSQLAAAAQFKEFRAPQNADIFAAPLQSYNQITSYPHVVSPSLHLTQPSFYPHGTF